MSVKMKGNRFIISVFSLFIVFSFAGCKKSGVPPTVETASVTEVAATTATCGGNVTDEGSSPVTARGVCWAAKKNPTVNDIITIDGTGTGEFTSSLGGLYPGVAYFIRAYATNSAGTSYGEMKSFIPDGSVPSVTTLAATEISATTATINGMVTSNNAITTVLFNWGTSTAYDNSVTDNEGPVPDDSSWPVSASLTGLTPQTTYHFRVYATNALGTSFGADLSFKTKPMK